MSSPEVYQRLERLLAMDRNWSAGASEATYFRVLFLASTRALEHANANAAAAHQDVAAADLRARIAEYELAQTRGELVGWTRVRLALRELGRAVVALVVSARGRHRSDA